MAFKNTIRQLLDGQPVNGSSVNRPLRDLLDNDKYLLSLIESVDGGTAIYRRGVVFSDAVVVGTPVYYNEATSRFEPALAAAEISDGVIATTTTARVLGICCEKTSSTSGDILLQGYAALDVSAAISGTVGPGLYFLSGSVAGKLTRQEPPVGVAVLYRTGDGGVIVSIRFADIFAEHQHYKVELLCEPCGEPAVDAGQVSITDPDADLAGWLPADHASFNGKAPVGAAFGYNLAATSLANSWPPLPLVGATLEWFTGTYTTSPDLEGLAVIDANGIWWLAACENSVPWPADFIFGGTTTEFDPAVCPVTPPMRLRLWYSRPKFATSATVVTSLQVKAGSLLTIRCLNNETAEQATGDLEIDIDLQLLLATAETTAGHIVLKGINTEGQFLRGPVLAGVKSGSGNLLVSGGSLDGDGYSVGRVTLTALTSSTGRELDVQSIRLFGATEENHRGTLGIGFPTDRETSFLGEIIVPYDLDASVVSVALRFWLLARAAGQLPPLALTAQVVARPETPTALDDSVQTVSLSLPGDTLAEDEYVEVTSGSIDVAPGSQILFQLSRDDSSGDGFGGEVHVIRQSGIITGVTV